MKNLIDDLVLQGQLDPRLLSECKYIDMYSAAEQFEATFANKSELIKEGITTNIAPPYPFTIFEFGTTVTNNTDGTFSGSVSSNRALVLCMAMEYEFVRKQPTT